MLGRQRSLCSPQRLETGLERSGMRKRQDGMPDRSLLWWSVLFVDQIESCNYKINIVSQVVLIKFMNEPTVTYKTVRAHELRLLRIGNSNLTRLPWSIWGKSGGATEVGTVDINSSCNSTKTETASHSLPKLSHCNVVSFTSSPVLSTICNTTHTL